MNEPLHDRPLIATVTITAVQVATTEGALTPAGVTYTLQLDHQANAEVVQSVMDMIARRGHHLADTTATA